MSVFPTMSAKILIIDDDPELAAMLSEYLRREGYTVETQFGADSGVAAIRSAEPDLLILDVMLPQRSGLDVLRELRLASTRLPVMMLTARGDPIDRILGLELGADDYLAKPFDPRELLARVRAILRRAAASTNGTDPASAGEVRVGDLCLELRRRRATLGTTLLELTGAEFRVLLGLAQHHGTPVDRAELTEQALGRKLTLYDRSIDTHVSNLRRKFERAGSASLQIRAVRGTGYELIDVSS
jgi:two-component system response regulator CpxR